MIPQTIQLRFSQPLKAVRTAQGTVQTTEVQHGQTEGDVPLGLETIITETDPATPQVLALLEEIPRLLQEMETRRLQMIDEFRHLAVELAFAIASKLAYREIENDAEYINPIIQQVLEGWDQQSEWTLALNPKDLECVKRHQEMLDEVDQDRIHFVPDRKIPRGDFRLETPSSYFVSSLQTKLTEFRQMILKDLSHVTVERRSNENLDQRIRRFPDRRSGL